MDFFERQWSSYRRIVEHDLMEHEALADATAAALDGWLAARHPDAPAPHLVDLGCGDLAQLVPLLQRLPLGSYTGLDLAAAVLPRAAQALGPVAYPTHWQEGDLLAWATGPESKLASEPVDILHSAFAIHHLDDAQKAAFLAASRRRISPQGLMLWGDVFREPGEALEAYRQRYCRRIQEQWRPLTAEQQEHVIRHLSSFDLPADRVAIQQVAEAAGWRWRWVWQGSHSAEALAALTPA